MMEHHAKSVCIDSPDLLTPREQLRDKLATGLMWALYAYLWLPLISLLAWVLGFEFAYDVMVRAGGAAHLRTVLFWYGIAIVTIFIIFGAWSLSNRLRFAGHDRRDHFDRVSDESFMAFFGLSAEDLEALRTARALTLELDGVGGLREIAVPLSAATGAANRERRHEENADDD